MTSSFADNLRAILKRKRMSISDLAKKLKVERPTIYNYLKARGINSEKAIKLAEALDCDPAELVFGSRKINTQKLAEVVDLVVSEIAIDKVKSAKIAELIAYLYEEHVGDGGLDEIKVRKITKLVM